MTTESENPKGRKADAAQAERRCTPLRDCIHESLDRYFQDLDGHEPGALYELVISEVEQPMLEVVMEQTRGNITRAAELLGLNRGTLRKKLKKYGLS